MGKWTDEAMRIRPLYQKGAQHLDDAEALEVKGIYAEWAAGEAVKVHEKRLYKGKLYRCILEHSTQADWPPDLTPNMWAVIDEGHSGSAADPIPAERGMEYTYGLYYLDPEDGKTYFCQYGDSVGTVVLHYLPHELAGIYFEEVNA